MAAWTIYGLLHSWLASVTVKSWFRNILGRHYKLYRLGYSLLALVLLVPIYWISRQQPTVWIWQPGPVEQIPGWLMTGAGILMAALTLRRYVSSAAGFRDLFLEGQTPPLQTSGWHKRVRHPLYFFTFLTIWGIFLWRPTLSILISDICISVYTLIGIRWEEKKLMQVYGKAYETYKNDVPMIIPFLY